MWNFGGVGILVICVFIQRSGSQTPTISPAESNILIGMNAEFACILPSAETPISWWRQSDGEVSETKDITVGTSGSNCITSPATPPSYLECSCVSTTQFNCTVKSITRSDHREKWRCSFNDASSVAQYSSYVYIYIKVGLGEDCDNADNITCATENADCDSGSKKCQCKTNYQQTAASECGPPTTTTATTTTTTPTTTTTTPSTTTTTTTPTTTTTMPPTTTTTTTPTTTAIETTTTSTTTTLTSKHEELSSTTRGSSELSTTKPSSVLPTTNSPNVSNERTVIIVVASTVGGVVLVGLVVFLIGLFLYRARRPGHGHGKHNGSHKRTTRQQQSGGSYIYSGPSNSQNREMYPSTASYMDTRHSYPYSTKGYPDRYLGVSVPKQSKQRHEGSQMRNTNYIKSKYSVYPGSANTPNFSPQHYHRYGERQRPKTTGNIHPGYVYPTYQSGYPHNRSGDYSDNWNMY